MPLPEGAHLLTGDIHGDPAALDRLLDGQHFDAVVDWIAYTPEDIERDIRWFSGKTGQFVFISSASAYQKPPSALPHHRRNAARKPLLAVFARQDRLRRAADGRIPRARFPGHHHPPLTDLRPLANPAVRRQLAAPLHRHRPHETRTERSSSPATAPRCGC